MKTRAVLILAGSYNLAFAVWLGMSPTGVFHVFGMEPPWPDGVSRGLAVVIGLFALAFWVATALPTLARPVLFLGLLSKIAPPLAWIVAVAVAGWPKSTFAIIFCDDLIWWIPFAYLLVYPEPPAGSRAAPALNAARRPPARRYPLWVKGYALVP